MVKNRIDFVRSISVLYVMSGFVMNSIGVFGKCYESLWFVMNFYWQFQNINCRGAHQLIFTFIIFIDLIMNYFGLVMNAIVMN